MTPKAPPPRRTILGAILQGPEPGELARPRLDGDLSVRFSGTGEVIDCQGRRAQAFAEAVAYGAQLLVSVGELLGLDGFSSMEAASPSGDWLMYRHPDGGLVACKPGRPAVLEALRRQLGIR